jgi:uncharacterized delta-60 repeat protein
MEPSLSRRVTCLAPTGSVLGGKIEPMKRSLCSSAVGVAALLLLLVGAASAAAADRGHTGGGAGSLDRAFGHNGLVVQGFGTEPTYGGSSEAAPMPDGGFVVETAAYNVGRYRADGSLDTTFGDDGYLLRGGLARTIATTADGHIYVLGLDETEHRQTLRRLLPDGTLDRSFADEGILSIGRDPRRFDRVFASPDGGVLLVGSENKEEAENAERFYKRVHVERLRPDGSPDPAYGSGGVASVPLPPIGSNFPIVYTLDGNRLLFAVETGEEEPFVLVRLQADGRVDPTLDPSEARVRSGLEQIEVEADGRIVVCGRWGRVLRLLPDGRPDPSFGEGGAERPVPLEEFNLTGMALRRGGGIFLGGYTSSTKGPVDLVLAALTDTGALDPTVGGGSGLAVVDSGNPDEGGHLTTLADGDVLLAGQSGEGERSSILAARFDPAGSLDPSFGSGGLLVTQPLRLAADEATAVAPGPMGTIVAGGRAARRAVVARYRPDGHLDRRFGEQGLVLAPQLGFETGGSRVTDLLPLPGGDVLASVVSREKTSVLALAPGGGADPGFGRAGAIDSSRFRAVTDLARSSGGSILAAGLTAKGCRPLVERFGPGGGRDPRFRATPLPIRVFGPCFARLLVAARPGGGAFAILARGGTPFALRSDGSVEPGFELSNAARRWLPRRIEAIAVDGRGALLLGGTIAHRLAVARITSRGGLDRRFGWRGVALREVGREAQVTSLLVEASGGIVAAGTSHTCVEEPCSGPTAILARFTGAGDPDRRFGRSGIWMGARGGGSLAALAPVGHSLVAAGRFTTLHDQDLLLAMVHR